MKKVPEDLKNFASKWNAKPHTELTEEEKKILEEDVRDSHHRKGLIKFQKKAKSSVDTIIDSGAGYYADQVLRDYFLEFNGRFWTYGLKYMPMSFNVFNKFLTARKENYYFELKEEIDHIFLCDDFFEYITDAKYENNPRTALNNLHDNVIYNYSVVGDPRSLKFKTDDSKDEFVICGISMIKDANELSWMMIGGPIITEEIKKSIEPLDLQNIKSSKSLYMHPDSFKPENNFPLPIEGLNDVWKNIVFGRTEIDNLRHQVRYLQQDHNTYLNTLTDDPEIIPPHENNIEKFDLSSEAEVRLKEKTEMLNAKPTLFNLAESLFSLPNYFNFKLQYVSTQEIKTKYGKNKNTASGSKIYKYAPASSKIYIKKIKSLQILNPNKAPSIKRNYTCPQFQVSVDGFWRRINPESYGKNKDGEKVLGRTWIKAHLRWREKLPKPKIIFLKSSVTAAKERLEILKTKDQKTLKEPYKEPLIIKKTDTSNGFIYLMRSNSMKKNYYKIGKTSKSPADRAEDLSDSTGVAEKFEVIDYWKCKDYSAASSAEQEIFASLDKYRVSDNREFFNIDKNRAIKNIKFVINKYK